MPGGHREQGLHGVADAHQGLRLRSLRPLQAAARTDRIAFGPRAGQKVLTVQGVMPRDADFKLLLCADIDGFSLQAAVRCGADDRQALEQLCRDITRPALANERVQTNAAGQVVPQEPQTPAQSTQPAECEAICAHHLPVRLNWAKLLKRVLATTQLEYKSVCAEASLSRSTGRTARTAAVS